MSSRRPSRPAGSSSGNGGGSAQYASYPQSSPNSQSYYPDQQLHYSPINLSPQPAWPTESAAPITPHRTPSLTAQHLHAQFHQPQQSSSAFPSHASHPPSSPSHHSNNQDQFPNPYSSSYAPIPPPPNSHHRLPPLQSQLNQQPHYRRQSTSANRPQIPQPSSPQQHLGLDPGLNRRRTNSHQPSVSAAQQAHGQPGHDDDDCPGCRQDYEAALAASRATAEQDAARRAQQESQEQQQALAFSASQEEEAIRRRTQEEEELLQVMEASRREHEERNMLKEEEERIILEESRQGALRDEDRQRRENSEEQDVLERSRRDAEEQRLRLEAEEERMKEIERMVMEESRREQEEEWRRRDSEERAMLMGLQRNDANSSSHGDEASYWEHHLRHDEAYKLSLQFQEASLAGRANATSNSRTSQSTQRKRLPLPPTPGSSTQSQFQPQVSQPHSHSKAAEARLDRPLPTISSPDEEEADPFGDHAEAPPAYEPPSSSRPASPILDIGSFEAQLREEDDLDESEMWVQHGTGRSRASSRQGSPSPSTSRPASISGVLQNADEARPTRLSISDARSSTPTPSRSSSSASTSRQDQALSPRPSISSTAPTASSPLPSPAIAQKVLPELTVEAAAAGPSTPQLNGSASGNHIESPSPSPSPSTSSPSIQTQSSIPTSNSDSDQAHRFKQTTLPGVDFGYSRVPFSKDLFIEPHGSRTDEEGSTSSLPTSDPSAKQSFPNVIQLTLPRLNGKSLDSDPSNLIGVGGRGSYFVLRAQSWRALLRAAAWFGNTRIEAGPEEIADAAAAAKKSGARSSNSKLKVELEFVTPSRIETGYGIGEHSGLSAAAAAAKARLESKPVAHVSLCLSLVRPVGSNLDGTTSSSQHPNPQGDLLSILKGESRSLDSAYLAKGSARRVLYLPREPPALPMGMVALAQHLHRGHQTSAACPTSSHIARHSPRDLHHAIERHDVGYVAKVRKAQKEKEKLQGNGRPGSANDGSSSSLNGKGKAKQDQDGYELFDDDDDEDEEDRGTFGRMKDKVRRRLAKRNGDGKVVNEDLSSWISECDAGREEKEDHFIF